MPDPKPDLRTQLLTIFAEEDVDFMMELFRHMKAKGFGRMVIGFKNGDIDIFEEAFTYKPPRYKGMYRAE